MKRSFLFLLGALLGGCDSEDTGDVTTLIDGGDAGVTDAHVDDSTVPPVENDEPEDMRGITAAHNAVRSPLGVPDLKWSPTLQASAQAWADHLTVECDTESNPHSGGDTGENIYWSFGSTVTGDIVVEAWASEVADYTYADNSCSGVCGHYTQVVWANTTDVGCARAVCDDSSEWWVCQYLPPGNFVGEKPY